MKILRFSQMHLSLFDIINRIIHIAFNVVQLVALGLDQSAELLKQFKKLVDISL